ncbi:MAG: pyridoxamine 5-phosphate oxidase [Jatrophihabitantaceae bacterium]|nr:pyridoxamine 5-phosphate oxidase [Jatrophihabitantaceae bacterium]
MVRATILRMTSWTEVTTAAPDLAATVRRTFAVRKHATMATTSRDGTPRISGTEVEFGDDGEIYLGMMTGAQRANDLRRDPRVAIHCPTVDSPADNPSSWLGDGKITAIAVEEPAEASHRFRLDITRVVHTAIDGDALRITSWTPTGGTVVVVRG